MWHSGVALVVYATTLGLLDGLHMALRVPRVGRPVIWMHVIVGLLLLAGTGFAVYMFAGKGKDDATNASVRSVDRLVRVIGLKLGRTESAIYAKARASKISLQPPNQSPYG